jgi:DNA-directed RNA polymerase subunit H (RpoH/RPB5)
MSKLKAHENDHILEKYLQEEAELPELQLSNEQAKRLGSGTYLSKMPSP